MTQIDRYRDFLLFVDANPFDFLPGEREIFFDFVNEAEKENLLVIGKNKAGCLICLYDQQGDKKQAPIVWLDSEQSPSGIFADNIQMFFSLLPYGTGVIHSIISQMIDIRNNFVNVGSCDKFKDELMVIFDRSSTLTNWSVYKEILQSSVNSEPCESILNSIKRHWNITERIIKK
jgi:hypothetical protein